MDFLEALRTWAASYTARRGVDVRFEQGPSDRPKRAAWIIAEASQAVGQLTLWESGECETEAASVSGDKILVRSRTLASPSAVAAVADDLVDHLADYSGT